MTARQGSTWLESRSPACDPRAVLGARLGGFPDDLKARQSWLGPLGEVVSEGVDQPEHFLLHRGEGPDSQGHVKGLVPEADPE